MDLDQLFAFHENSLKKVPLTRRYLYSRLDWTQRAICLWGARGVGKTTLLQQYFLEKYNDVEKGLYISADNIQVASLGLFSIAEEYFKYGGELLMIDEVHKYPNWSQEIKNIIDTYKQKQIFFSGSSAIALNQGLADLSRRIAAYTLRGLSFREFLELQHGIHFQPFTLNDILKNHIKIATKIIRQTNILKSFREYVSWGYYPFFLESQELYHQRLLRVIERVLTEDIPAISNITPPKILSLKKLLWLIASSQPFIPHIEKMSSAIQLSKEYTYHFVEYLEKAGLLHSLFSPAKGYKRIRKPGKIFLENTNMLEAINGSLKLTGETGTIRETFFVNQLKELPIFLGDRADFIVDKITFEIGGKSKKETQLEKVQDGYLVLDNIEIGNQKRIPLYLFGFLY